MPTTQSSHILEATETFVCEIDGERFTVHAGISRVAAGHKLVLAHPTRFRPVEENLAFAEDATMDDEPGQTSGRARTTRIAGKTTTAHKE